MLCCLFHGLRKISSGRCVTFTVPHIDRRWTFCSPETREAFFVGRCAFMWRFHHGLQFAFLAIDLLACTLQTLVQFPTLTGVAEVNFLAFNLYNQLTAQQPSINVFFSPLSISSAFARVYVGSGGKTKTELERAFGLRGWGVADAILTPGSLVRQTVSDGVELLLADKLYVQQGFQLKPEFVERILQANAIEGLDFVSDPEGSRRIINQFVNAATRGNIPEILEPGSLDELTRLAIANGIFFKGIWRTPFDPAFTTTTEFKGFDRSFVASMMIRRDAKLRYAENFPIPNSQVSGNIRIDNQALRHLDRNLGAQNKSLALSFHFPGMSCTISALSLQRRCASKSEKGRFMLVLHGHLSCWLSKACELKRRVDCIACNTNLPW